jgi:hypothetical protein
MRYGGSTKPLATSTASSPSLSPRPWPRRDARPAAMRTLVGCSGDACLDRLGVFRHLAGGSPPAVPVSRQRTSLSAPISVFGERLPERRVRGVPCGHVKCVPKWRITLVSAQVRAVPATVCKRLPVPAVSPNSGSRTITNPDVVNPKLASNISTASGRAQRAGVWSRMSGSMRFPFPGHSLDRSSVWHHPGPRGPLARIRSEGRGG